MSVAQRSEFLPRPSSPVMSLGDVPVGAVAYIDIHKPVSVSSTEIRTVSLAVLKINKEDVVALVVHDKGIYTVEKYLHWIPCSVIPDKQLGFFLVNPEKCMTVKQLLSKKKSFFFCPQHVAPHNEREVIKQINTVIFYDSIKDTFINMATGEIQNNMKEYDYPVSTLLPKV